MKQITSRLVGLLFICLISGFAFTNVYAKTMGEKRVRVHGSWDEEKRSVSPDIPIIVILALIPQHYNLTLFISS